MTISRNLSIFAANVTSSGTYTEFASGTLMLFQQTTAPTGWTKQTTHHDKALRVVTGSVSSGGAVVFSGVFANTTPTITTSGLSAGATTLTTAQMPSHTHGTGIYTGSGSSGGQTGTNASPSYQFHTEIITASAGSAGSHSHSISGSATSSDITLNVAYVDLIIASKA
jgi:hypothetical protein